METAGPGGNALGRGALKKKITLLLTAMIAGPRTVSKTVALARRFARSGLSLSMFTTGTRCAGMLKIALRAWLVKYQLMLRKTLGNLSTW